MLTLTKSYHFCAAHRMWNEAFSEERNRQLYGKCANDDGHGHNYSIEVTISGTPDPESGLLIPRAELDAAIGPILERLDHHHINAALKEAGFPVATSEALAAALWQWLKPRLGITLHKIRVIETERNAFEFVG